MACEEREGVRERTKWCYRIGRLEEGCEPTKQTEQLKSSVNDQEVVLKAKAS